MKNVVLLCAFGLAACASDPAPKPFLSPDGRQAFAVNCSEGGTSACHTKARAACGGNYEIIESDKRSVPVSNPVTGQLVSLNKQSMSVVCSAS